MLRRVVRRVTPSGLRVAVAQARRAWRDGGSDTSFAKQREVGPEAFPHRLAEIVQDIKGSAFLEGKLANIRLGAARLDGALVAPGETFSFWALVGRPSAAAGFQLGRSIRGDAVGGEIGGGLCQVSGIAYEAGLRAGLVIAERHPHSRDLYTEAERFTPLGMDATVVWPYRDLRLLNPYDVPVRFGFAVSAQGLVATVHAPTTLSPVAIEIERTDHGERRRVRVVRRGAGGEAELISDDVYVAMPGGSAAP